MTGISPDPAASSLTVDALMRQARENERKWQRILQAELRLMSSATLDDCINQITGILPRRQGWDGVCLTLVDEDYSLRRILSGPNDCFDVKPNLRFVDSEQAIRPSGFFTRRPVMEKYHPRRHSRFFGKAQFESVCVIPLLRAARLTGTLAIASHDPERFSQNTGPEFVEHLATVVAISIEAVSSRDQLRMISLTDPLTGVSNRRFFDRRLRDEMMRARREAEPVALLFIDVDHFKTANDVGGHAFGDDVLRQIARAIGSEVRQSDVLCRYGGDEFACLLTGTALDGACDIAERVRAAVQGVGERVQRKGVPHITVSIGVSSVTRANDTVERLVQRADDAVYAAKSAGRNNVKAMDGAGKLQADQHELRLIQA